jgi:hypothetical protein
MRWLYRLLRRAGLAPPCRVYALGTAAGVAYSLLTARRIGDSLDLLARALRARQREA